MGLLVGIAQFAPHWAERGRKWHRSFASAALAVVMLNAGNCAAAEAGNYKNGDYEFFVGPAPVWVVEHTLPDKWDADAPGAVNARWRNWLVDGQIDRRRKARSRFYDRVYEPVSSELVQDAGKYQIWFSPDYQKLTIHRVKIRRNGTWSDRLVPKAITLARRESDFERDMANGLVSALIVLDDVRAGDLVRISYTLDGDNPVLAGLVDENFIFAANDPILDRHARVLFDVSAKLVEQRDPAAPKPVQRRGGEMLEWAADAHAIAGVVDEGGYPPWYDAVRSISIGESRTWADVAAWARALYPPAKPLPADLEQRIAGWRKFPEPEQRVVAALRTVQEDVRYFGTEMGANTHRPSEPADTWTRRYGDCKDKARLLATILGRLDIEAHPALVSYDRGRAVADLPPAASVFDHVIVEARLGKQTLWLDATQTQQRGSPLQRAPGEFGVALPVADGVRDLVTVDLPDTAVDRLSVVEHVRPDPGGKSVALEIDSEYEGAAADRMRRRLKANGGDKIEREFADYYRKRYGEVSVKSAFAVTDDEADNKLKVNEQYLLKNPWVGVDPGRRAIDFYADALGSTLALPKTATRAAPMRVDYPIELQQRTLIDLPDGWQWLGEATQRKLTDSAFDYRMKVGQSDRVISVEQDLRALRGVVAPADYSAHFALLREANDLLSRRLILGVAAKDAGRERDQRLQNLMRNILEDDRGHARQGGN